MVTFSFTCETSIADTSTEKFLYDRGDYDRMLYLVSTHDWELLLLDLDVEVCWEKILDCLNHAKRECIPKKKLRRDGNQPYHRPLWMDHRTLTAIRRKHQMMWERYLRTQQGADYVEFAQARNKARKATRRAVRSLEKK